MNKTQLTLRANLEKVRQRISDACSGCGRDVKTVKLVAVTKYVDARVIRLLVEAGCNAIGENRSDALRQKFDLLDDLPIEWHFIGHLQRNKIKFVLPRAAMIQSVDSLRLMEALNEAAAAEGRRLPILLETNISGDSNKNGFRHAEVLKVVERMAEFPAIRVFGVMGMAGLNANERETTEQFSNLKLLSNELFQHGTPKDPLTEISMGMSGDFEIAIATGATIIRVGSALFEGLEL